jgi:hypothetical protein
MSESVSDVVTATAASLVGVWLHDPIDPTGTIRNYLYTDGRSDRVASDGERLVVHGRRRAIAEFGEHEDDGVSVKLRIPFSGDHDSLVGFLRDAVRNRRAICYRDNRGRVVYGVLLDGVEVADVREGSEVVLDLSAIDYDVTAV